MNKEKLGKRLGALALTGIIASVTLLPCTVNATEVIKNDNTKMISSKSAVKKGKKQGKKMSVREQTSGDTIKKEERKAKFENLTDEEKEALKAEREAKKAEREAEKSQDGSKEKVIRGQRKSKKPKQEVTS